MHASASTLQLVTFDADGTLYADGAHMAQVCFFSHRKHVNAALTMKPGLPYLSIAALVVFCHRTPSTASSMHLQCRITTHRVDLRGVLPMQDNRMIHHIIDLMQQKVHVAIVTAAGYPGDASRFEQRVEGLLAAFRSQRLLDDITNRCVGQLEQLSAVVFDSEGTSPADVHALEELPERRLESCSCAQKGHQACCS